MIRKYRFLASILGLCVLSLGGFARVSAQETKCDANDKKAEYEILLSNITDRSTGRRLFLDIYVKSKRYNVVSMVELVKEIRMKYCDFDSIGVAFFDTRKMEKMPDPPPDPLLAWIGTRPRGFFEYDKGSGSDELTFQEVRGDEVFDVEIKFRPDGYCVSEEIYHPDNSQPFN